MVGRVQVEKLRKKLQTFGYTLSPCSYSRSDFDYTRSSLACEGNTAKINLYRSQLKLEVGVGGSVYHGSSWVGSGLDSRLLSGSVTMNAVPTSTSLSTLIWPPCTSTDFLTMASPNPVPDIVPTLLAR